MTMRAYPLHNNFNGGEVSPKLDARTELDKYASGCITAQGCIPLIEGGAARVPGTLFVAETKDSSKRSRLVPFRFSAEQSYVIEFGDLYARFYKDLAQIDSGGTPVEVVTPFDATEILNFKYTQSADVLYLFESATPPTKLTRTSHTSWFVQTINFLPPPTVEFGHELAANLTLGATSGSGIVATASASVFLNGDVGRIIRAGVGRAKIVGYTSGTVVTVDILDTFISVGPMSPGSTGENWMVLNSPEGELTPSSKVIGTISTLTSTGAAKSVFRAADVGKYVFLNGGFVKLKTFTSALVMSGEVIQALTDVTATSVWTMESTKWNSTFGYPSCGVFFEQRLAMAGAPKYPQTINFSSSADYENFTRNATLDDAAIEYTLVSSQSEAIHWMAGEDYLQIGTLGGVWTFGASSSTEPLTQTNVSAKKPIKSATRDTPVLPVTDSLLWVAYSARVLNRLDYSLEKDKQLAVDLTRVASHITIGGSSAESGIVETTFQQSPFPIVWAVRADGVLLGMTYSSPENVYAWFRVVTDGYFESAAVISDGDSEDQLWVIVRRVVNGATKRLVEVFKPFEFFSEIKDSFFVHSGATYDGGEAVVITGITQANPAVVSAVNTFVGGETVRIDDVLGMTQANTGITKAWTVANPTGAGFELSGIDSTGWGAYISGGTAQAVRKAFTSGLDHLEGAVADILVDGAVHPQKTISGGAVTLNWYGNLVHIGRPAPAILEPTRPALDAVGGNTRGKKQRIHSVAVSFYETYGCKIGKDLDHLNSLKFGTGDSPELFTGEIKVPFDGDWGPESPLVIVQDLPLPMTVRSITYGLNVSHEE